MTEESRGLLRNQLVESAGNVQYTYSPHWNIYHRLRERQTRIKVAEILLTAASAGGFLASLLSGKSELSWVAGATSAVSLGLNLYMLNFNLPDNARAHEEAANELWDVREAYKSLLVDFDSLDDDEIRRRRDALTVRTGTINKNYPGTDDKSFSKAQKDIVKYQFVDGKAAELLHVKD